jgi:hypothetical protein
MYKNSMERNICGDIEEYILLVNSWKIDLINVFLKDHCGSPFRSG